MIISNVKNQFKKIEKEKLKKSNTGDLSKNKYLHFLKDYMKDTKYDYLFLNSLKLENIINDLKLLIFANFILQLQYFFCFFLYIEINFKLENLIIENIILYYILFLTILTKIFIIIKYIKKFDLDKLKLLIPSNQKFYNSIYFKYLIIELLINILIPNNIIKFKIEEYNSETGLTLIWYLNDILLIFSLLRILPMINDFIWNSTYFSLRLERVHSIINDKELDTWFVIKCFLKNDSKLFLLFSFFISMFIFSNVFVILENKILKFIHLENGINGYYDSCWFFIVTMTTSFLISWIWRYYS